MLCILWQKYLCALTSALLGADGPRGDEVDVDLLWMAWLASPLNVLGGTILDSTAQRLVSKLHTACVREDSAALVLLGLFWV